MRKHSGFTLIELLVVVAIIAVLMAIMMPALSRARAQSAQVVCMSNLKQMYMVFTFYAEENNRDYPKPWNNWQDASGNQRGYWYNKLMGHGMKSPTSEATLSANPWILQDGVSNPNYLVSAKMLRCPAAAQISQGWGLAPGMFVNYGMTEVNVWYTGYSPANKRTSSIAKFFTTKLEIPGMWPLLMDSTKWNIDSLTGSYTYLPDAEFQPRHMNAANVLMADGSFKSLKYNESSMSESALNGAPLPYSKGIK